MIIKKLITTTALASALTLGAAGVAGAAGPPASTAAGSHTVDCTRAAKVLTRLEALDQRTGTFLSKAPIREQQAVSGGHPVLAARIEKRITRVQKVQARLQRWISRIQAACPAG